MFSRLHHQIRTTPWLGRLALKVIPDWKIHLEVEPIGKMAIRLRQHRMYWLRPALNGEKFMLGSLQRLVRSGDVVFDLGANIGLYSRFLVQQFHASRVFAFEPMQNNRALLTENLALGGCGSQVTVVPRAVGDQDGQCDFQVDALTSNSGTLDAVTHGKPSQSHAQYGLPPATVQVQVSRLDTMVESEGFPPPGVIKLDVEGAEAMALTGARNLLLRHKPRLVIELHGSKVAREVLQILWAVDYHCFGHIHTGGAATYREIVPADLNALTDDYTVHYLAASALPEELREPIEDFAVADFSG